MPEKYIDLKLSIHCRVQFDSALTNLEQAIECYVHDMLGHTLEIEDPNTGNTVGEIELHSEGSDWAFMESKR